MMKVMELLKDPHITFEDAGILCKISPSSVIRVFDRHCHLPSVTFPEALCIDEVYTRNSDFKDSKYSCIFYDFYRHRLVDVLPARTKNYLHHYFQPYQNTGCLDSVKYVVIDIHSPYGASHCSRTRYLFLIYFLFQSAIPFAVSGYIHG